MEEVKAIGATLFVVLAIVYGTVCAVNQVGLHGALAEIEQLREDIRSTRTGNNEDVVGQATQWNQAIKRAQAYNRLWYLDLAVADEWDSVEPIQIPAN